MGGEERETKRESFFFFFARASLKKKQVRTFFRNRRAASLLRPFTPHSNICIQNMLRNRFRPLQLWTGARARPTQRRPDAGCSLICRRGVPDPREHSRQGLFPSAARGSRTRHQWTAQAGAPDAERDGRELL